MGINYEPNEVFSTSSLGMLYTYKRKKFALNELGYDELSLTLANSVAQFLGFLMRWPLYRAVEL